MSAYLENYLESVSTLPGELNRNFSLVRELDEQSQELLDKVEDIMLKYRNSDGTGVNEMFTEDAIQELRANLNTCVSLGDERVSLALQTYELVDKHIRRLDQDLKKFEHELELQRKQQSASTVTLPKKPTIHPATIGVLPSAPIQASSQPFQAPPPIQVDRQADSGSARPRKREGSHALTSGQFEMPIDPNEPRYCLCNGYSAGNMVGCDNRELCPIEWFHFECVGLTAPVKGRWLCPRCREDAKNKK